jgi:hypothetical protein
MERNNMILPFFRWRFDTDDRRQMEKRVSERVNRLGKDSKGSLESLTGKVEEYVNLLAENRLKDENIARRLDLGFLRYLAVIAGFPVAAAGFLSNILPFLVPRIICNRFIKDLRFYSSVYVSSGTVLYLIYFPAALIIASVIWGLPGFLLTLLIPFAGYFTLFYQEICTERLNRLRYSLKRIMNPALIRELKSRRRSILDDLNRVEISTLS